VSTARALAVAPAMDRTRGALWQIPTRTRHLPTMQVKPVGTVGVMAWPQLFSAMSCDEANQVHGTGQSVGKAGAQGVPNTRQIHRCPLHLSSITLHNQTYRTHAVDIHFITRQSVYYNVAERRFFATTVVQSNKYYIF